MRHENLHTLNAWCKSTGLLYPWVSFYSDRDEWAVRIIAPARGQGRPLRTCYGADLEAVCAEILPKAQQIFEQQKHALKREAEAAARRNKQDHRRVTREIEAMHHSADDY